MNRILQATHFAALKHTDQRRKNPAASPYINHPAEVAWLLSSVGGIEDENVLIAALLHDTIEDTETSREEIVIQFGEHVARLVCECTDDKSLAKAERKRLQIENAPHKSHGAKCIKLADKLSNLKSMLSEPPLDWPVERQREYFIWAEKVVAGLRGVNLALEQELDKVFQQGFLKLGISTGEIKTPETRK